MRGLPLITLILISIGSHAQQLSYKQFTVKDGLPGSIIYHSLQDRNGFIWFATNQGVSRFDGRSFRNFTKEDGLPDNEILQLFLDKFNNVWFLSLIGTPAVFYNGHFICFDSCRQVRSITEDAFTDSIVFMTMDFNKGLCGSYRSVNQPGQWKFTGNLRSIYQYFDFPILKASSPGKVNFYFSTHDDHTQELILKSPSTEQHYRFRATIDCHWLDFGQPRFSSLTADRKGIVFMTMDSFYYSSIHGTYALLPTKALHLDVLENSEINDLFYENDSTLWICTRSKGLLCIKDFLSGHMSIQSYFSKSFCTSITKDRENGYWVTTHSDGVYYLPNLRFYSITDFPGLAIQSVRCIRRLDKHNVIAGFSNGIIMIIDDQQHSGRLLDQWAARNKNNRVLDVGPFLDNTLLVATDAGLHQLFPGGKIRTLYHHLSFKEFFVDGDSIILSGASDGARLSATNGRTMHEMLGLRATCVTGLKGVYFWGTLQGLFTRRGDRIYDLGKEYPPLSGIINHIDIAPDSSLWVCTEQGIVILKKGALSFIKKDQGLPSNLCKHISFDGRIAWVSTNKGISRIDYDWENGLLHYSISNITEEDGLTANDVNQTIPGGDYIWAATARGISFFSKNYQSRPVWNPLINITHIISGDKSLAIKDTLVTGHQSGRILIELSGISYRSGNQIRYEYRLKELDSSWTRISSNNIEFPTLPFGRYHFEVRAIDRWGEKSALPKRIFFMHDPPYWQSGWFHLLSYLAIALLIGASFYVYHRRRHKQKEKEYLSKKKMQDLEMMALRAQMNPHFIFNCLMSIQYHIMRAETKNASDYLHQFSTLIRQTLQNSTAATISLRNEIKLLELYLNLEKLRFGEKMDFRIDIPADLNPDEHFIPPMIIQPYVENAIKHGISPRRDGKGIILLQFKQAGSFIECTIDDNGPGIGGPGENDASWRPAHRSMGTSITGRRIETINELQEEKIIIRTIDKHRSGLSANGTLVHLSFPKLNV
jgi:two-component sensor histidine kinase